MDFSYSKTEQLFLQMVRSFAENEVKPLAAEIDEQERFPIETVEKMGKLGMMGIPVPKQYGGAGGTVQMYIMAVEELSRVCATTGVVLSAHTSLCIAPIMEHGTEEQKMKYLPKLASGEWIGALASLSLMPVPMPLCSRPLLLTLVTTGYSTAPRFSSPTHPMPTCLS